MAKITRRDATVALAAGLLIGSRAGATGRTSGPPLWVVDRGGSKVFLFGQMPVKTKTPWLTSMIQGAFEGCRELWTENPDVDPAVANASIQKTLVEGGLTVAQFLSPHDLKRLHVVLERSGQKPDAMDGSLASLAYFQISNLADMASGADFAVFPERVLKAQALAAAKPIHSEWSSFEEATEFMSGASPLVRRQLLRKALDDFEGAPLSTQRLAAWLAGDLSDQEAQDARWRRLYPDLYKHLSAERNAAWAPRILTMTSAPGACFICVGLGHLVGPQSIQAHLADVGLTIRRL